MAEFQYVELKPLNGVGEAATLTSFLARTPAYIDGRPVTVKKIINGASNALGGVHYDATPRPELTDAVAMWRRMSIGSFPVGFAALNTIAEICLEALEPLVGDVSVRTEAASSPEEPKAQGTLMTIVEAEDGWHLANLVRPVPLVTSAGVSITGCIAGRECHLNVTIYGRVFYFNFVMPLDEIKDRFIPLFVIWDIDGEVRISSGKTLAAQPFNCPTTFRGKMTELPSLAKSPPQGSDR